MGRRQAIFFRGGPRGAREAAIDPDRMSYEVRGNLELGVASAGIKIREGEERTDSGTDRGIYFVKLVYS